MSSQKIRQMEKYFPADTKEKKSIHDSASQCRQRGSEVHLVRKRRYCAKEPSNIISRAAFWPRKAFRPNARNRPSNRSSPNRAKAVVEKDRFIKAATAASVQTSRRDPDRLLDPKDTPLHTLHRAAAAAGRQLRLELTKPKPGKRVVCLAGDRGTPNLSRDAGWSPALLH
jgi:hypothetical protein